MTGGTLSILANRISYVFDLHGPSLTIDTACSSSLVALHHACEAIRDGRIENAIVGGINLLLAPYPFLGFCRASMLSRRGRCFAFDERADGYVRGEGGGAIILKPLTRALADGDRIRAVIRGTGVNSDGRTLGLSLPSEAAQTALIRSVYARAGVDPDDLAFFDERIEKGLVAKLQGIVSWFDNFCVLLRRDGQSQLVYKHAISTVMPSQPVQLYEPTDDEVD